MISLFIDTSLENVSISLLKDGKIISSITKFIPNKHSMHTTSLIKMVLDKSHVSPQRVDDIYIVNGPGSFTGLRIGVTIAKTYGYLIKKELIPVSSLKMLALSAEYKGVIMSIIPANKKNYYVGIYDEDYQNIYQEQFIDSIKINELVNKYHPYIVGTKDILGYDIVKVSLDIEKIIDYYQNKTKVNYFALVPNYLKLPQALEDKNK